jgi:hypothetical protein
MPASSTSPTGTSSSCCPPPQGWETIDFTQGAPSPQNGTVLDSVITSVGTAAAQSVFQSAPESQLASIEKLPFLRQSFGYAVAQVGAAALSQKYPAGWARPGRRA